MRNLKRLIQIILALTILLNLFTFTTWAAVENVYAPAAAFTDAEVVKYAENTVIMRVNQKDAIVKNYRHNIDSAFVNVKPFIENDVLYLPIEFLLNSFEISYEKEGESIKLADKKIEIDKTEIGGHKAILFSERLFVAADGIEEFFGLYVYVYDDLIIVSKNKFEAEPSKNAIRKMSKSLEWVFGQLYLGTEGFVTGIVQHPKNPELMYARTDVGGFYRWEQDSSTWIPLIGSRIPFNQENMHGAYGVALDPNDENVIYICCGMYDYNSPHDILKSTDRGYTWKRLNFGKTFYANQSDLRYRGEPIAVDPNNSNIVWCGTTQGLFISKDAGESWNLVEDLPNVGGTTSRGESRCVVFDANSPVVNGKTSVAYVSVQDYGVYKTEDGGNSFTLIPSSPQGVTRMVVSQRKLYISSSNRYHVNDYISGLHKYDGKNIIDITPPYPKGLNACGAILIDRNNPNMLVVSGAPYVSNPNYFYRSFDDGRTWENMGRSSVPAASMTQDEYTPGKVYFSNGRGIYTIEDIYSDKWVYGRDDYGIEELVCDEAISLPDKDAPLALISCMDRGYEYSEFIDVLAIGQEDIDGKHYGNCYATDFCEADNRFVARAIHNSFGTTLTFSTDYGRTSEKVESWPVTRFASDLAISATVQANGYPVVMVSQPTQDNISGKIWRSKDWGKTWESLANGPNVLDNINGAAGMKMLLSDRVDGKTFYFCEEGKWSPGKGFYVTTDSGETWKKTYAFGQTEVEQFMKTIPGVEGGIWYQMPEGISASYDKGATWSMLPNITKVKAFGFGKGKPGTNVPAAYIMGVVNGVEGLYMSDDLGKTWNKIDDDTTRITVLIPKGLTGDRKVYGRVFIPTGGTGTFYAQKVTIDDQPPRITVNNTNTSDKYGLNYAVDTKEYTVTGNVSELSEVRINNIPIECTTDGDFIYKTELKEGVNTFRVEAVDRSSNKATPVYLNVRYIPNFFAIQFDTDREILINGDKVQIIGQCSAPATVYYDDRSIKTDENNRFVIDYTAPEGDSNLTVFAKTDDGIESEKTEFHINRDITAPIVEIEPLPESVDAGHYIMLGKINEAGEVRVNNKNVVIRPDKTFYAFCTLSEDTNTIKVQAKDVAGNINKPVYYTLKKKITNFIDTNFIDSQYKVEDFQFDGELDDWNLDFVLEKQLSGSINNLVKFNTCWDDEYLYIGVSVLDDVVYNEHSTSHENDAIEIYIDGNNDKSTKYDKDDHQFIYVAGRGDSNCITKLTDTGYTMEIRIPWIDCGVAVADGVQFGFDIDCCDNDMTTAEKTREGVVAFNGTLNNWSDTSGFSTITIKKDE